MGLDSGRLGRAHLRYLSRTCTRALVQFNESIHTIEKSGECPVIGGWKDLGFGGRNTRAKFSQQILTEPGWNE